MPATLTVPTTKIETYAVSGKTLVEIAKSIDRKGPIDPNDRKRVVFLTETVLDCNPDKGKYKASKKPKVDKKTGWFEAEVQIKTLKVTMTPKIRGPKRSVSGLSTKAFIEWIRFYVACMVHEGKHVEKAKKECQKIIKEMNAMRGKSVGETEAEAETAAINSLIVDLHNFFVEGRDRLNKLHFDFDKSTDHGKSKGAKLDTSVT